MISKFPRNPLTNIYKQAENWRRNEEEKQTKCRPEFPFMPASFNTIIREKALMMAARIRGYDNVKSKFLATQAQNKLSISLDSKLPAKIAGCSTQYVVMLCHILNGDKSWYINELGEIHV